MSLSGTYCFNLAGQSPEYSNYKSLLISMGMSPNLVDLNMNLKNIQVVDTQEESGRVVLNFSNSSGNVQCVENIRPGILVEEIGFDGLSKYKSIWYRYGNKLIKHSKPTAGSGEFYSMERTFDERKMITTINTKNQKTSVTYFKC
eukprot:TRINITY_DN3885_c0_g1_i3.p1 TRINITY_DN3885_c0_g1~~TRINITY_DN3885_c0_g1_i3.p1  ORF type:complete len:145 (+),score=0.07 TRINITY_DN3885_c0_g1_i3:41-475(+)